MTSVHLELPEPPSANRWWRNWRGRMVLSTEARAYIAELEHLGCARGIHPYAGDVRVSIDWHRQRRSGDLDKRVGILLDALQGVAYVKDAQVAELHAWRRDGSAAPGTVSVTIEPLAA